MSRYSDEQLNSGMFLVGMGRRPWWQQDDLIAKLVEAGGESPLYDGPIPLEDVRRRHWSWTADEAGVASLVEVTADEYAEAPWEHVLGPSSGGFLWAPGMPERVVPVPNRKAMVRSDTKHRLGEFSGAPRSGKGYQGHQYANVLGEQVETLLGEGVGLETAGIMDEGAVAFVSASVNERFKVANTDVEFYPRLMAATSFNGTLATTWKRIAGVPLCDNTFDMAMAEDGAVFKLKHSRYSVLRIADAREALGLLEDTVAEFTEQVTELVARVVSARQWNMLLDAVVPVPETPGRSRTLAESKRDRLQTLWTTDPRVSPWKGTAFGVLQAFNTYGTHDAIVRNVNREERRTMNLLTGKAAEEDRGILVTLDKILAAA